jgi:hypothetical protein
MWYALLTLHSVQSIIVDPLVSFTPVTDVGSRSRASGPMCPSLRCQVSDDASLSDHGYAERAKKIPSFFGSLYSRTH